MSEKNYKDVETENDGTPTANQLLCCKKSKKKNANKMLK